MVSFIGLIFIYVIGGITFLPLVALAAFIYIKGGIQPLLPKAKEKPEALVYKDPDNVIVKKGWIRLTNQYQPKMPEIHTSNGNNNSGIISGIQSYVSKEGGQQKKGLFYAVLKHGTLFCYESEKMEEVAMILPIQDFQVSLYPPNKPDKPEGAIYGRTAVTRLVPNSLLPINDDINLTPTICTLSEEDITCNPSRILYLTCARGIDKEDWYLGLVDAQHLLIDNEEDPQFAMMDNTHFDACAMEELIRQVQSSPSHRETSWINAVFGRLFLGMYKTDRLKDFVEMKIRKKIDKTKRPTFLDEISVRKVDVGESVPFITNPKLLSLSPSGEVVVEAQVEYNGGLTIEIETDFNWSYHSRMKPIRMHLILSVKLKKMSGRLMFKLKAPPTNRYWLAFFEMPEMEWKITPVVADKQIKLAIVTNAIESRIREVMAETFVLPNMDDTSFCPSEGKGGIFGEYVKVKRRKSKETAAYVHEQNEKEDTKKHTREDSVSSEHSRYRENPTVPEQSEKAPAVDVLKLKNRRAESVNEFSLAPTTTNDSEDKNGLESQKIEMSRSTPDLLFASNTKTQSVHSDDNDSVRSVKSEDQHSLAESTGSKWSNTSTYLRKRMMKPGVINEDDEEQHNEKDAESTQSSNSNSNGGLLSKVARLLPADTLPPSSDNKVNRSDTQSSTSSTGSNKRSSLIHMAENFLTRKNNQQEERPNDEPLSEEKRNSYVERLANMRKRAEEKRSSMSSAISSIRSPPPLPALPSRSSTQSSTPSSSNKEPVKSLLDDDTPTTELDNNMQKPIVPTLGKVISSDSSRSLLDNDETVDVNKELPAPIKPARGRAASAVRHQDSESSNLSISSDSSSSRRNSTPPTFTPKEVSTKSNEEQSDNIASKDDVSQHMDPVIVNEQPTIEVKSTLQEEQGNSSPAAPVNTEEKKAKLPPLPNKPRPPLPTSPRPKLPPQEIIQQEVTESNSNLPTDEPPSYQEEEPKPELPPRENHDIPLPPPPVPPRHA